MELDEKVAVEEAPSASEPVIVEEFTDTERQKWLDTPTPFPGKEAEESAPPADKKEAESEAPPASTEGADKKSEDSAPPEPVQDKKPKTEFEARFREVMADNRILKQRLTEMEKKIPAPTPKVEAAPSPQGEVRPQRPDPEKYKTAPEYMEALADWKVGEALHAERMRVAEEGKKSQASQREQAERENWGAKVEAARAKHPDFTETALNPDLPVAVGSAIDWWVMNSEHGAEVLHYYGKDFKAGGDLIHKLNAMPMILAAKELARVESEVTKAPVSARPRVPQAPPPPSEANNTRGSVDPMARAIANGDFDAYSRLKNAEERKRS